LFMTLIRGVGIDIAFSAFLQYRDRRQMGR
jgi:hypothetical protein